MDEPYRMTETYSTPYDHIVFTDFDGVEGILVDLNTKKYYQLNETAMMIWKGLEKFMTPDEIARDLAETYDTTPQEALRTIESLLKQFEGYKLVGDKLLPRT